MTTRWAHQRHLVPELTGAAPERLLARTAALPGNARLACAAGAAVEHLEEVRVGGHPDAAEPEAWLIESALDESAPGWKRRGPGYVIPAGPRCPQEVVITPAPDGVRVEAALAVWDELGAAGRAALATFLCRAQAALRFARCEIQPGRALVAAQVAAADVEAGLAHALAAVAAAAAPLARDAGALLHPDLAAAYLRFNGAGAETGPGPGRI